MSWLKRVLPDLLVVLLVVGTSSWLMQLERRAAAMQATRLLVAERRELIASHLERTVDDLSRVATQLASAPPSTPVRTAAEVRGLWLLGLDGAVQAVLVEPPPGTALPGAADVATGRDAWRASGLPQVGGATVLRLAGPVRGKADARASAVLVALIDTARLLRLLDTPVDNRRALAGSLCLRHGSAVHRLDTAAGKAISDADVARALGREEAAALRMDAEGRTYVVGQQQVGFGTLSVVVLASLEESLPASSFPQYVAIPVLVLLGLGAVLWRQPVRFVARPPGDSIGLDGPPVSAGPAGPPAPPVRPGADVPVLKRGRLEMLRKALGTPVMTELINSFTSSLPARVTGVRTAHEDRDAEAVASRGHSLFGSAANLGLERLSAVGHWLDVYGRTARSKELAVAVDLIESEADAGLRAMASFLAEQPVELDGSLAAMAELYVRLDGEHLIRAHSVLAGRAPALAGWLAEGKPFLDGVAAADRERLREALVQVATNPRRELVEARAGEGASAPRIAWSLCRAPGGGGVLAFGRDMAPRDADSSVLAAERDEAVAALRARSDFLALVTHELRTPLNAVIGMTGLLLTTELTGEQKDCAQVVRLGAENLLALVNDILDFSKIEAGRMELESIAFDLRSAVDDVVDLLALKATQRKVQLVVDLDPHLPPAVRGDLGRLRQILINLTDNALKFTGEGGLVTIRARALPPGDADVPAVRFEVQDTGAGIPPAVIARLFQPFSQADASTTRRFGGTGLGLAICKQLVGLMGGGIGVDSRVGLGSTFWFAIPMPAAGEGEVSAIQDQRGASALEPMPFPLRALVVDDNAINQLVATRILERLNVKTDVAGSGREALEMLRLLPYDMIFMDYQMPDMDGGEATRQIRQLDTVNTRIPVIGLTADAAPETRAACLAVGMDDFLAKPVVPATLSAAVARWAPAQPRVSWRDATTGALGAARGIFADTPSTAQHFDRSRFRQIQELAKQHTDSFFLNVVEVYLTSTKSNLESLKRAVAAGQREAAAETAASLRRASEHMGAVVLAEQCRGFDDELRAGGDLTAAIAQIEREVDAITQVLVPRR